MHNRCYWPGIFFDHTFPVVHARKGSRGDAYLFQKRSWILNFLPENELKRGSGRLLELVPQKFLPNSETGL